MNSLEDMPPFVPSPRGCSPSGGTGGAGRDQETCGNRSPLIKHFTINQSFSQAATTLKRIVFVLHSLKYVILQSGKCEVVNGSLFCLISIDIVYSSVLIVNKRRP